MSAARSILAFAAVAAGVPLALSHDAGPVRVEVSTAALDEREEPQADPATVRAFLDGVRGSNAIQCEMVLQSFVAWGSNRAPDRDSVAWAVMSVVRQRLAGPQSVADLVTAVRGDDPCVARVAARLLGRSRQAGARQALLAALRHSSAEVRRLAAIGLGFSSDSTTSAELVRVLTDRDDGVRAAAAWALGAVH